MTHRALSLAAVLCLAAACKSDGIVAQGDDKSLDRSTTSWDDGPAPTPDPPLTFDGGSDAGSDAATPPPEPDAGPDAASDDAGPSDSGMPPDASPDAA
jgi:hypothetical protein